MLIPNLRPISSALSRLQEIPATFFRNLEAANSFGNSLFPDWLTDADGNAVIFARGTVLREKFQAIYTKYKAIPSATERQKIIDAFDGCNQILRLCNKEERIPCLEVTDLDASIRSEIDEAFLYLYNSGLRHPGFEAFAGTNIRAAIKTYLDENGIEICPFCGLETILLLQGQDTVPLDHWLNKDRFPFASINFENLIPIGTSCNSRSVKGTKNVLKDSSQLNRIKSYYPYSSNQGISVNIQCSVLPNYDDEQGTWNVNVSPNDRSENNSFKSWCYIFNIPERFSSYLNDYPCLNWQKDYVAFIRNQEDEFDVNHATNIIEFKANLRQWKRSFPLKKRHGSVVYRPFLDFLINQAPDYYLQGLVENILRQGEKGYFDESFD